MQKQTDGCNLAYDKKKKAPKKLSQRKKKDFLYFNIFLSIIIPIQFLSFTFSIPQSSNMITIY